MIIIENSTALNDYLEENQHQDSTVDKTRLTKLRKLRDSFDPLLDQSDTDITTPADLNRIADINTEAAAANSSASVSEREIVVTQLVGIHLTCPFGHVWVYTGRLDLGYTNCSKCKASVKLPRPKEAKA
ncbi:MAG: hypothetical protein WCA39_12430 [Nitrososphaeraceae archaeon]